ncbi:hypothetical protein SY83_19715 [Paenibacillus swuensis]|uniref:Uncharacterized protein n=1 Tax=Paenibacillus swuensis TaxID=1178515 RepID=A0A172TMV4_9BACL|nr:hypothetical protein [Paenibacillus swuensis]ANE48147.1 hypothetical protein SY83_19715 [Paenibacillus swuensis]
MVNTIHLHRSGEHVLEAGTYISENGVKSQFSTGATFPACPADDTPTTWRHSEHEHRTGDRVTETGEYICSAGETRSFEKGAYFPVCPVSGEGTLWKHV